MTHPNRNWQRRWSIDFEQQTATHKEGWVFEFKKVSDGVFDGKLIRQPENLTLEQIKNAPRIAREADEAWERARKRRQ
ncbi:hypothetical protein [Neisseria cinerea]|uniref:hypothetical protein n=1 Tax=Neisseria cinerea TaxID=483 RepID=UPI0027E17361|nr:hypothetical protein [Neisseria cinerea]